MSQLVEHSVSGVGVLDKAMAVVGLLEAGPCALTGIVASTGLSRATAYRLVTALEAHGLLRRTGDRRYELGMRLVGLGHRAASGSALVELADPVLRSLRDTTGESSQLYVPEGDRRRCLRAYDSPHELRTIVEPGALLPLGVGSAGRLFAGERPGPDGWLETVGDRQPGVASVSAPVRDGETVIAAISVSGPIERIGARPGDRHGVAVVAAAQRITASLAIHATDSDALRS